MFQDKPFSTPIVAPNDPTMALEGDVSFPTKKMPYDVFIENNLDVPISQYEQLNQEPFLVKHLGIDNWSDLNPLTDINNVQEKVRVIDLYIMRLIQERNLEDSMGSHKQILNELQVATLMELNSTADRKIDILSKYVLRINNGR